MAFSLEGLGFAQGAAAARKGQLEEKKLQIEESQVGGQLMQIDQNRQKLHQESAQKALADSVARMNSFADVIKQIGPNFKPGSALDKALDIEKGVLAKAAEINGLDPRIAQGLADRARAFAQVPQEIKAFGPNQVLMRGEEVIGQTPEAKPSLVQEAEAIFPGNQERQRQFMQDVRLKPATEVNISQKAETKAEEEFGKVVGGQAAALLKDRDRGQRTLDQLQTMEKLAAQFEAAGGQFGALAGVRIQVSKLAQSMGINPAQLGLPADTDAGEALIAGANDLALGKIGGEGGLPANNFTETDRNFVVEIVPNIENTKRGFQTKLMIARRVAKRNVEAGNVFDEARASGKSIEDAQREVRARLSKTPLFSNEEMKTIKGVAPEPVAKGADFSKLPNSEFFSMNVRPEDQEAWLEEAKRRQQTPAQPQGAAPETPAAKRPGQPGKR